MAVNDLKRCGATQELIDSLSSTGLKNLYPPQVLALEAGLLRNRQPFVIAAPTASGKTLIAEMAVLDVFLRRSGKTIYSVPLRALAREKYEDLSRKYAKIGMKVAQSTGDFDRADPWLRNADLIISTNEKIDSLLRHRAPWFADVRLVIADEVHLIGDRHRGPTLEMVLTRLRSDMPELRVIALSATIPNADEIARWLGARLVASDWRPVPLREGVYFEGAAIFNDGTVTWVERKSGVAAIDLAVATIREGGQALLFVNTRKSAEAAATKAARPIAGLLEAGQRETLKTISHKALSAAMEPTKLEKKLAELMAGGVAFHHAGIRSSERKLIEDGFRENRIKFLAATTTLAMGLNLPSRRVIIRDWRRYEAGAGMVPVPVMEIKQMSGRAGRPGFDEYGEAVLIAGNKRDERILFERYIKGKPEDVKSRLGTEAALRTHILASVSGGFASNREEMAEFLRQTLFALQNGTHFIASLAGKILAFLSNEDLVRGEEKMTATRFGRRVSELYIDPLTGVILRQGLILDTKKETFGLLHLISRTPDMMKPALRRSEIDRMLAVFSVHAENLLPSYAARIPTEETLSEVKTAALMASWIEEIPEDRVTADFGVGPGDIHNIVELADWLLYSALEVAKIFKLEDARQTLLPLRERVVYGVKEELLPLVALRGIGRIRARNLFNAGYRGLEEIRKAGVKDLEKVPSIGGSIAEEIKKQVEKRAAA